MTAQLDRSLIWCGSVLPVCSWLAAIAYVEHALKREPCVSFTRWRISIFGAEPRFNSHSGTKYWKKMKPLSDQQSQHCHLHATRRLFDLFKLPFGKQGTGTVWALSAEHSAPTSAHGSEVDQLIQTFHLITSLLCTGGVGEGDSQDAPSFGMISVNLSPSFIYRDKWKEEAL